MSAPSIGPPSLSGVVREFSAFPPRRPRGICKVSVWASVPLEEKNAPTSDGQLIDPNLRLSFEWTRA
jgi:hypothetical protein